MTTNSTLTATELQEIVEKYTVHEEFEIHQETEDPLDEIQSQDIDVDEIELPSQEEIEIEQIFEGDA